MNAQLKIGGLEETITVSGRHRSSTCEHHAAHRAVAGADRVAPHGRSYQSLAATIPALAPAGSGRFDVGGSSQMWQGTVVAYGSLANDTAPGSGRHERDVAAQFRFDLGRLSQSGRLSGDVLPGCGGSAESQTGGVRINMIPKEGGNRFSGDFLALYSNEHFQSENLDAELRAKGLNAPGSLVEIYDYNGGLGGPILKDRLWFYHSMRRWGTANNINNQYNADGSPAVDTSNIRAYTTRLTGQLNSRTSSR